MHLDMDAFFAQAEERENPQFKGKPVVVGADPKGGKGRGVVSTANYKAREYGIHSALPISRAYNLCPQAVFLPVNMDLYERTSSKIMKIIKKYSPKWEVVSVDEAYLDISFLKNYKEAKKLAEKIKKEIFKKEKLICTIGIGSNKLIAKMATNRGKPDGLLLISPRQVELFLDPLDVQELPGIGPKTAGSLREIGVNKIKELRKISKNKLKDVFGKAGEYMYDKSRGVDKEDVSSEDIVKSIGKEITFEKDTRNSEIIFKAFNNIIRQVYQELEEADFSFKTITVVCRFEGFETHTKSETIKKPSRNLAILRKKAKGLLLKFLVSNFKLIRLVGLRVSIA